MGTAQGESPEAAKRSKSCVATIGADYGSVRRQGHTPEEAQDLTHVFLHSCLSEKAWIQSGRRKNVTFVLFGIGKEFPRKRAP